MYSLHLTKWAVVLAVLTSSSYVGRCVAATPSAAGPVLLAQAPAEPPSEVAPPLPPEEQPEVLTSGPVHEAFAKPVDLDAQPGLVAPVAPPPNVEEVPPAERPVGDHYVWIPGYWSWDADRKGHVWVSACWRVAPPNMQWVPGYWSPVPTGFQWVPGFWAPAGGQEIEYISAPPPAEDATPLGAPPSADATWVPACSYWVQTQYVHRPGYWLLGQPGWTWVPSHYVWTPRGYVFCRGHWDYPLENRGVLFSPVVFSAAVYARGGFSFSPSIVVDLGGISASLFVCPRYSHYYFGDYYDDVYVRLGIFPRFESGHGCYDPIYVYDRWRHVRTDPRWEQEQRHDYDLRRADKDLRPARTYREMQTRLAKAPEAQRQNFRTARPLAVVAASKSAPMKFQQMDAPARQKVAQQAAEVPKFREQRNQWEAPAAHSKTPAAPTERRQPAAPTPAERKPAATPAPEARQPSAPAAEPKAPAREPRPAQSERIKTPPSPIGGQPADDRQDNPRDNSRDNRPDQGGRRGN